MLVDHYPFVDVDSSPLHLQACWYYGVVCIFIKELKTLGVRKCAVAHLRAGVARQLGGATSSDGEIEELGE